MFSERMTGQPCAPVVFASRPLPRLALEDLDIPPAEAFIRYHRVMRYSALLSLFAAVLLSFSAGAAPLQDTVETVDGQTLTGIIGRKSFLVETEAGDRLEIPRASIRQMTFDGDQVDVQLTEGDGLHGRLLDDEIHVRLDRFDRVLNADEVRRITFARAGTLLPEGTEVELRLLGPLDPFASPATTALLCVNREVRIGDETALPKGTPVLGRVVVEGHRPADPMSPADFILSEVVTAAGTAFPCIRARGCEAPRRRRRAARRSPSSRPPVSRSSPRHQDTLLPEVATGSGGTTATSPGQRCEDAALAGAPSNPTPVDWLVPGVTYRGAPEPLELQLALEPLFDQGRQSVRLSNLPVDDTRILNLNLTLRKNRNGAKLLIRNTLAVAPSRDRVVDLRYALLAGDRQIADRRERGVEVEERKTNTVRTKISLSAAQLDALTTEGPALLRISMTVEDD